MAVSINPISSGGDGAFVDVGGGDVSLDSMNSEIQNTITYTRDYANTMMADLNTAIDNLGDILGTYSVTTPDVDVTFPTIDRPSFPIRPDISALVLDSNWPDGVIPEPDFQEYGDLDFSYTAPPAPSEVDESFSWTEENYTSDVWQALFSKIHTAILNGDYGLTDSVHAAIVDREQESRRQNQDREFRNGLTATGATGFNLPGGHTAAFLSEFQAEVLKRDQDALNNITVKDFEIANENEKFYVTSGTQLEQVKVQTFNNAQNRSLDAEKATKEYLARFFDLNTRLYVSKWEGIKIGLESLKVKIDAIANRNNSEADIYKSRADALESRVRAVAEKNRGIIDSRRGEIDIYDTEVKAIASEYAILVEEVKANQESNRLEIEKILRTAELNLQAFTNKSQLAKDIALGEANIASQGVASALGAINTSLSNSYQGSESISNRHSFNASITETHRYEEE